MYASGIPLGLLTDARGPRLSTILGAITLGAGYYPIYQGETYGFCSVVDFMTDVSLVENSICAWRRVAGGSNAVLFLFSHWLWKLFDLFCIYQDRYV